MACLLIIDFGASLVDPVEQLSNLAAGPTTKKVTVIAMLFSIMIC